MMPKLKLTVAMALIANSLIAHADCAYPKAPGSVPDGRTATQEEMAGAMQALKAYDAEVKAFSACLDEEAKKATGSTQLMQIKTMQAKKVNAAVGELQAKAKEFNEQLRAFKAKNG